MNTSGGPGKNALSAQSPEFLPGSVVDTNVMDQQARYRTMILQRVRDMRYVLEKLLQSGMHGKDVALAELMDKDPSECKFVKISYLLENYPEVSSVSSDPFVLYSAIHDSLRIHLSPCGTCVGYSQFARDVKCTVYVDGFPEQHTIESLYGLFSIFGAIRSIVPCTHVLTQASEFNGYAEIPFREGDVIKSVLIEYKTKKYASLAVSVATGKDVVLQKEDGMTTTFDKTQFANMHIMPMFAYLPILKQKMQKIKETKTKALQEAKSQTSGKSRSEDAQQPHQQQQKQQQQNRQQRLPQDRNSNSSSNNSNQKSQQADTTNNKQSKSKLQTQDERVSVQRPIDVFALSK